jgi:hypothetical protein
MNNNKIDYDIAAYYWPAYHDDPRWRRFMPEGEGEWEIIHKAQPKFNGHYQPRVPLWGYKSEADPLEMEKKIDAAADHNVNVFIFDWYWYKDQPFLEDALNKGFLEAKNNNRIHFFLMWANHNASTLWDLKRSHRRKVIWPGAVKRASFDKVVDRVINCFFKHPSYYKIDGMPVFSIYEINSLIKGLGGLDRTREALASFRIKVKEAGFPGLHLQAILWGAIPATLSMIPGDRTQTKDNTLRILGFDSITNYQWCHYIRPKGLYKDWAEQAIVSWDKWSKEFSVPFYPHVSIGWDTNPRYKALHDDIITGNTPALFGNYIHRAMDFVDAQKLRPRLITVNSWNEWSEGSYLEPDMVNGMKYLEELRDAVDRV